MSTGRKTKAITYNLFDRGRQHTGIDRSNVDLNSMVDLINSAQVQEMVRTGQMIGYYGHQVRQRFGMIPPESVPINGKMVYLEPAHRTISIKADKNGDVTHQAEFFDNRAGEFARQQYQAKVGGFSTAVNYLRDGVKLKPSGFFGFDYVTQPNYATNIGDGQLFDGLFIPESPDPNLIACFDSATELSSLSNSQAVIAHMLEEQIIQCYDNIDAQMAMLSHIDQSSSQINYLQDKLFLKERKQQIQAQRQEDIRSQFTYSHRSFDSALQEAEEFLGQIDEGANPKRRTEIDEKKESVLSSGLRSFLGFGG